MHEKKLTVRYFILSFAIGFLLLSVAAMLVVLFIPPQMETGQAQQNTADGISYLPSNQETLNLLLVVEPREGAQRLYALLRFDPARGQIPVAVLPPGTLVGAQGRLATVESAYTYAGIRRVAAQLEEALGIAVDRYLQLDVQDAVTLVDLLGGVQYRVKKRMVFNSAGTQTVLEPGPRQLSGNLFGEVLSYSFPEGELERSSALGNLIASLLNDHSDLLLTAEADSVFQSLVNMGETNVSALDYQERKPAARFMARLSPDAAFSVRLSGQEEGTYGSFQLSEDCRRQLAAIFSPLPERT
ncbi:MAG: LCP family protein [Provencibacterium sp.]|nr:LCP family protein [Provencibacterium sp.]